MTRFLVGFWVVVLASWLWADGPWAGMYKEQFIKTALNNVQQEGDFYFIPFPEKQVTFENPHRHKSTYFATRTLAAQRVLEILDGFKKRKANLTIVSFTVEKENDGEEYHSVIHGIFVHAVPNNKK